MQGVINSGIIVDSNFPGGNTIGFNSCYIDPEDEKRMSQPLMSTF